MATQHVPAPFPLDEAKRIEALERLDLLDTPPEKLFDDLVTLAQSLCDVPIALVSLVDRERQWFKARVGLDAPETHRDLAFCAHAILSPDDILVVEDTHTDPRFSQSALVLGPPHIRFYAGAPIISPDGYALGTVCVIDRRQRTLTPPQREALRAIARQASALLNWRSLSQKSKTELQGLSQKVIAAFADTSDAHAGVRQTQRVASIGQLASGVAHDFNNLLQAISVSFQILERKASDPAQVVHWSKKGLETVGRGASLITQLLALSKIRPPETKPLSVAEHVREASELFLRVLGSGITFELLLDDTNAMVTCDPTQLESAVLNMLINARDAMNGVGRIWIRTRVQHIAYDADLPDGEYMVLEVGDNGPGMSAEIRARVFEPFFSTKAEKGTGLGLAQVLGFAMHANGAARIESEPGDGTLIQLYLKTCSDLATPQATPAVKAATPQSTAKTKILLIEDNPEVRNALAALLDVSGFLVHPVASGFTAVQSIEHYIPDVVITDCGLPAFNGPAIARVLHELIPKIPVIFLTGASDMDAVRAALPLNAVLLQKPTSIDVLCDAIDLLVPTPRK